MVIHIFTSFCSSLSLAWACSRRFRSSRARPQNCLCFDRRHRKSFFFYIIRKCLLSTHTKQLRSSNLVLYDDDNTEPGQHDGPTSWRSTTEGSTTRRDVPRPVLWRDTTYIGYAPMRWLERRQRQSRVVLCPGYANGSRLRRFLVQPVASERLHGIGPLLCVRGSPCGNPSVSSVVGRSVSSSRAYLRLRTNNNRSATVILCPRECGVAVQKSRK